MRRLKSIFTPFLVFFLLVTGIESLYSQETLTIYLFRHAEKDTAKTDPGLTLEGVERAQTLLSVISEPTIDHLFSTNYKRTLDTIRPFAERENLEITLYNPRSLAAFADSLKTLSGVALVSGHSNTTPELIELLTGEAVLPIDENTYDRLFMIHFTSGGYSLNQINYPPFSTLPF